MANIRLTWKYDTSVKVVFQDLQKESHAVKNLTMTTEGSIGAVDAEFKREDKKEAKEKQQKNDNDEKANESEAPCKVRSLIYNLSNEKSDEVLCTVHICFQLKGDDRLDKVIKMHKLPVERCIDDVENTSGSCWYASIAKIINTQVEEGKMSLSELQIKTKGPVSHQDVRAAVGKFMRDDCIMAEYWIEQHFDGNQDR